jgi:acyl-coenzyme A thioesterase PaaI-like protein
MNQLEKIVSTINRLPERLRAAALTVFFGRTVKYTGTSGIRVELLTKERCVITLKNRKAVQNHIGSVHAVANALIAESATGYVVGMNVPDAAIPVIKTIKLDYVKRSKGDMRAEAWLTPEQIEQIATREKGEVTVAVKITDAEDKEPVLAEMVWAWTPKKR